LVVDQWTDIFQTIINIINTVVLPFAKPDVSFPSSSETTILTSLPFRLVTCDAPLKLSSLLSFPKLATRKFMSRDNGAARAPRFEGEDVSPTTERELRGWYSIGLAAEIYAVCGVGMQ
jgi:hypothetical protein